MEVKLLAYTPNPDILCADIACICYQSKKETEEEKLALLSNVIEKGHLSVIEHASFTFLIEGISRVASHQLVRHRLASYTQQSFRYTKADKSELLRFIFWNSNSQSKYLFRLAKSSFKVALSLNPKDEPKQFRSMSHPRMNMKIKLFDSFAGIGSLHKALRNLRVDVELVGMSETDIEAIRAYNAIHYNKTWEEIDLPTREEMETFLKQRNIGLDFKRRGCKLPKGDKLKEIYKICKALIKLISP